MTQTHTQIQTRQANILSLLRKHDPAGVGIFPESEINYIEYAHEASLLVTVSDENFITATCNLLQSTYGRVVDAYMTERVSLVASELQKL
jgi:hypothetical protein